MFLASVEEILVPALWPGAVVVLDNLRAHRVKGVRVAIEGVGARLCARLCARRLYLPPSSPGLHPIALAWSQFRSHLRRVQARPTEALGEASKEGGERLRPPGRPSLLQTLGLLWLTFMSYALELPGWKVLWPSDSLRMTEWGGLTW